MDKMISILSLIIAVLAVFIGPLVSLRIAKRQIQLSLGVANKQIIAPMRQVWINNLRDLLAELLSRSRHYYTAGFEDRTDQEYLRLTLLEYKIKLMLNAKENDHKQLEELIRMMISSLEQGREKDQEFVDTHQKLVALSRQVFKREWDVVKEPIN
ncbi:MAG TPA: hypothetical protein VJR90_01810 [Gammaproteobacteria bacterium]|nr:hypothetical protein [Gammaproteobacteria bacterium]